MSPDIAGVSYELKVTQAKLLKLEEDSTTALLRVVRHLRTWQGSVRLFR